MSLRLPLALLGAALLVNAAYANWTGPADPAMHKWFDQLASGKGLCCSFADGVSVRDVDWDTVEASVADAGGASGHSETRYRVRLDGQWIVVPPDAVVTEPNRFGPAVVWPFKDYSGATQIRCFMPGPGA